MFKLFVYQVVEHLEIGAIVNADTVDKRHPGHHNIKTSTEVTDIKALLDPT